MHNLLGSMTWDIYLVIKVRTERNMMWWQIEKITELFKFLQYTTYKLTYNSYVQLY